MVATNEVDVEALARSGDLGRLEELLGCPWFDPRRTDEVYGRNLMHWAAILDNPDMIRLLLEDDRIDPRDRDGGYGWDDEGEEEEGSTPLEHVVEGSSSVRCLDLLVGDPRRKGECARLADDIGEMRDLLQ